MADEQRGSGVDEGGSPRRRGMLDAIEWLGNKLPDPAMLFVLGALIVMALSQVAVWLQWEVTPKELRQAHEVVLGEDGHPVIDEQSGGPVVRPVWDADGEPELELTDDGRRMRPAFRYVFDDEGQRRREVWSGQPVAEPVLDEEGEPVLVLVDDGKSLRPKVRPVVDDEGEPVLEPGTGRPVVEYVEEDGRRLMVAEDARAQPRDAVVRADGAGYEPVRAEDGGVVQVPVSAERDRTIRPRSLLTAEGLYWCLTSMVDNFMGFAPLGVVLTGMLGIGVAERTGLIGVLLKACMTVVPMRLLTPAMVFLGIMSSLGTDAGYVVLPPLAAALYASVGRSPLVGIAAVFAGVSAGFNANLFITGLDPMLAELSQQGARVLEPEYEVAATCNWGFMVVSTFVITLVGWFVTARFVERRFDRKPVEDGGPPALSDGAPAREPLTAIEARGLKAAVAAMAAFFGLLIALILIPGSPLHGSDGQFPRWVRVIVPILFFAFLTPGVVYGVVTQQIGNGKDVARLMVDSMSSMAPIIVLAFFAAQFIEYFQYSHLDRMLAMAGGQVLADMALPIGGLLIVFILLTIVFNLFIGSMSAKYAMFAPIFVPMFMMVGISPELTQAAYRIGDSVSNVITPLNAYLVIILVFMRKYAPSAGIGTLISMMMPYTIVFTIVWTIMLLVWVQLGIPLGPGGPLTYTPGAE